MAYQTTTLCVRRLVLKVGDGYIKAMSFIYQLFKYDARQSLTGVRCSRYLHGSLFLEAQITAA